MFPISDIIKPSRFPVVTMLLIGINIYIFIQMLLSNNIDALIYRYALVPESINFTNPQTLLPFITSMFMHGGWLHIFSNLWFLHIFGDNVEDRLGKLKFTGLYLLSGIAGAFAQYIINPFSTIPILGASAAISGVLGAYMAYFSHHRIRSLVIIFFFITFMQIPAGVYLFYWFVIQLFQGIGSIPVAATSDAGGVAFLAHAGGFVMGFVLAKLLDPAPKQYLEGEIVG